MLQDTNEKTGILERLCPVAGSMGEWMAVIDGQAYLTWPGTAAGLDESNRCRDLPEGTRVTYQADDQPTMLSTGRRASTYMGPPTVRFLNISNA